MKRHANFQVTNLKEPIIVFDFETLEKIKYITKTHPIEWAWQHRVERRVSPTGQIIYFLFDLFVPLQEVSGGEVEYSGVQAENMWKDIRTERGLDLPELSALIKTTSAFCHSHHSMGVGPSGTDENMWKEQLKLAKDGKQTNPQVMLIFNKKEDYFSRVYDPELGLVFEHLEIVSNFTQDTLALDKIMKEKFIPKKMVSVIPKGKNTVDIERAMAQLWDPMADSKKNNSLQHQFPESELLSGPLTDELFCDKFKLNAYSRDRRGEIARAVDLINNSKKQDALAQASNLFATLNLSTLESYILNLMLFYLPNAMIGLATELNDPEYMKTLEITKQQTEGELIEKFESHTIDPPIKFIEALEICKVLAKSSKPETIGKWISVWRIIDNKYDQMETMYGIG